MGSPALCLLWKFPICPLPFGREQRCHRASRTRGWIWSLHWIEMLEVLNPQLLTRPNQVVILLLKYRISDFFSITALTCLQALFSTFIFPWHRTQVHASSLDMHADMNFNKKKIITQITKYLFYHSEHIRHRNLLYNCPKYFCWSCAICAF